MGLWKGVGLNVNETFGKADAPIEVYNLNDDLGETKNIAAEHPEIVQKFREIFKESHVKPPLLQFPARSSSRGIERVFTCSGQNPRHLRASWRNGVHTLRLDSRLREKDEFCPEQKRIC